jgi:tRNA (cmo5U34)-methyltransferase
MRFDLIVSSMTMHHVKDAGRTVSILSNLLRPGGRLAIADLYSEDGTFHPDKTGVFHHGFDREHMKALFRKSGLADIRDSTAFTIPRETPDGGIRNFPVFLVVGTSGG